MSLYAPPSTKRIAARDYTRDLDVTDAELRALLDLAADMKQTPRRYASALQGRYLALLFEKPSLRTRVTFELAIKQLGGDSILSTGLIGEREPIKDIARNLDRWTDGIVARVFSHRTILDLAEWSSVPVVNALCDRYHPCQALADMLTIEEKLGRVEGRTLAFIGDGNNVAHSLMSSCARLGMNFRLACPDGYDPDAALVEESRVIAANHGTSISTMRDPVEAVSGADAVYTDVWASMGQESQAIERRAIFQPYQVNEALMAHANTNAIFMHCLPAKRNQETTDAVMESPQSVVFDQAENRLHTQKALLLMLVG
ncbi:MAG TPA: ornithine carbamoyltransferase [Bryobacteraceae bacterium]|jgi:ornithine carbamoyltransferase